MKSFYLKLTGIFFIACVLLISSCKKNVDDDNANQSSESKIETILNVSDGALLNYQSSLQSGLDSIDAFLEMSKWVIQQDGVSKAFILDLGYLRIEYTSGLESMINIISTDANGQHLTRGGMGIKSNGKNKTELRNSIHNSTNDYEITNHKALVFSPFNKEFYDDNYTLLPKFGMGDANVTVDLIVNEDADLSVINNFKNYGLIILDCHGLPQGFCIKNKVSLLTVPHAPGSVRLTKEQIAQTFIEANSLPIEKFINKELVIVIAGHTESGEDIVYESEATLVTDKYIRNLPQLNNAVVMGNYCYSGWTYSGPSTNNSAEAFKSIGAVAYYGYAYGDGSSKPVANDYARAMEDSLISNLIIEGDSTGIAHLNNNLTLQTDYGFTPFRKDSPEEIEVLLSLTRAVFKPSPPSPANPFNFLLFFDPRYKYDDCGNFTDPRDGNVYPLACIGNQTWFAENLRYNIGKNYIYYNQPANLAKYGRSYTYGTVSAGMGIGSPSQHGLQGICPQGWHIPSESEITELYTVLATNSSSQDYGTQIKAATLWDEPAQNLTSPLRNKVKLNIYPSGTSSEYSNGTFLSFYEFEQANIWLSSNIPVNPSPYSVGVWQITDAGMPTIFQQVLGINNSADFSYHSCRCIQD